MCVSLYTHILRYFISLLFCELWNSMVLNHQYRNHRAVAPIIATLILILITAVGGGVTFSYAQDIINDNQVSSSIAIEQLTIVGWDFRDISELRSHNGLYMKDDSAGIPDGIKSYSERVTIYIQNKGLKSIRIDELRFVGTVYEFAGSSNYMSNFVTNTFPAPQEYVILTITPDIIINSEVPELPAGKIASLVLGLDASFKMGRHAMLKLTTDNGFVIVKIMPIGSAHDIHGINFIAKPEDQCDCETPETCAAQGYDGASGSGSSNSDSGDSGTNNSSGSDSSGDSSGSANGHGSTGSDSGLGSSGSGSSGGSQPCVGSGSSGPAPSSTN